VRRRAHAGTHATVPHGDEEAIGTEVDVDLGDIDRRVLQAVGQGLLDDAERVEVDARRQWSFLARYRRPQRQSRPFQLVAQVGQAVEAGPGRERVGVEAVGVDLVDTAQEAEQAVQFGDRFAARPLDVAQRRLRSRRSSRSACC
jgi:hypothetical protein